MVAYAPRIGRIATFLFLFFVVLRRRSGQNFDLRDKSFEGNPVEPILSLTGPFKKIGCSNQPKFGTTLEAVRSDPGLR
jgi:hypothetical protein